MAQLSRAPVRIIQEFEALPGQVTRTQILAILSKRGQMLRIQRSSNGQVIFVLSGEMGEEEIADLESLIRSEEKERPIVLDLKEVTLVAREAISFLERCEGDGVVLMNCATYVREWIARQRNKFSS